MNVEFLLIGQGICGTFLSYYLQKENKSFLVIDNKDENAPSRIAAGIINPVTGRRLVTTWMIDELMPFAWNAYSEIGHQLNITAIAHKNIIDFFPTPQMREAFLKKMEEDNQYVHTYPEQNHFNSFFNYDFGCGEIRPAYMTQLEALLPAWRKVLSDNQQLLEEYFDINDLKTTATTIQYRDITAERIIFCDGASCFNNPYFKLLPFAPNKGEAIIAEIRDLPVHNIYKKGFLVAPLSEPGLFWIGSSYEWDFTDTLPSEKFRNAVDEFLKTTLKIPAKIIDHKAGERPATLERRPFVGLHPLQKNVGILNGMGTKGCSLAPYFARQLTDHLVHGSPIRPDADVKRFYKILARN